jgi:hypothetical protein
MTARRLVPALLLAAFVVLTGCTFRGHARLPEQTAFVPGTPRPSASASWHALGEAYLVAADRAKKDYAALFSRRGAYYDDVKYQQLWCRSFMRVDIEYLETVQAIPWTAEYQAHVDDVVKTTQDVIDVLEKCVKSKKIKTIHKLEDQADAAYLLRQDAAEALRKDLHLSTAPMR